MSERVVGLVLAGGSGRRLQPLTRARCKPAVAFAGGYRIVDFVLSNMLNSGIRTIHLLAQYQSRSLEEHLRAAWQAPATTCPAEIRVVPPRPRDGAADYRGTADAVWQNLDLVHAARATLVAIFGSDHVYRMDIRQMVDFHRAHGGGVTLGAAPVPLAAAPELGILRLDGEGRVLALDEKPAHPPAMPGAPGRVLASMGVWLVNADLLVASLARAREAWGAGADAPDWMLTPATFPAGALRAYDLRRNRVPGEPPGSEEGYWRDVGTLRAWWGAHMDLLGPRPRFALENGAWPLRTARIPVDAGREVPAAQVEDCLLGEGAQVAGATLRRSVLGRQVRVAAGASVVESILLDHVVVGAGARLERVIVEGPNSVPAGVTLRPGHSVAAAPLFPGGLIEDPFGLVVVPATAPA